MYFAAFFAVTMVAIPADARLWVQEVTTVTAAALIEGAGVEVAREGTQLFLTGITLVVDWACTAVTILALYVSLLLAHDAPARLKATGIAVGTAVLFVANQLRILATALAAEYWPDVLYIAHDYLFQISMVVVTVALWIWWIDRVAARGSHHG